MTNESKKGNEECKTITGATLVKAFGKSYESMDELIQDCVIPAMRVYKMSRHVADKFVPLANKSKYDGERLNYAMSMKDGCATAMFPSDVNPRFVLNLVKKAEDDYNSLYTWNAKTEKK